MAQLPFPNLWYQLTNHRLNRAYPLAVKNRLERIDLVNQTCVSKATAPAGAVTNGSESGGGGVPDSKKPPEVIKSRIESWLKDAEEDADKAEKYLDKKKANIQRRESGSSFKRKQEHKLAAASSVAKQTDVLKALEVSWRVLFIN